MLDSMATFLFYLKGQILQQSGTLKVLWVLSHDSLHAAKGHPESAVTSGIQQRIVCFTIMYWPFEAVCYYISFISFHFFIRRLLLSHYVYYNHLWQLEKMAYRHNLPAYLVRERLPYHSTGARALRRVFSWCRGLFVAMICCLLLVNCHFCRDMITKLTRRTPVKGAAMPVATYD